jgi:excisionase family DNA binding protein
MYALARLQMTIHAHTQVLDIKEAAAYLRMSKEFVYRTVRKGKMPGKRIGNVWRFRLDELEQYASGVVPSGHSVEEPTDGEIQARNA